MAASNNIRKFSSFILLTFFTVTALAQGEWNWPEDPELQSSAKEKQAYYKIQTQLDDYNGTFGTLKWLYENNPELNPSIYIDGVKTIQKILKDEVDKERITSLEDSLLWMFDQRIKYFGNEAVVVDRKAYEAFKLMYRKRSRYPELNELFKRNFEVNGNDVSDFTLVPYMTLAKFYHEWRPQEMTAEMVLDIHDKISQAIDYKITAGGKREKLKKDQDKVDAFLSSLDGILTCEFIEEKLVPKMKDDPSNLNVAKKIFKYSLQAKCTDQPYFTEAGALVYEEQPTYRLAKGLGDKYHSNDETQKAISFYSKALELAMSSEEQFDTKMGLATCHSKLGNKKQARSQALEALALMPGATGPYNLIGNLYFTSFSDCKLGESKVLDRAIFIAAYEMYEKAGNQVQMDASKEQFPSIEEIFNENYEEGQEVVLGCWINTTVALARRD